MEFLFGLVFSLIGLIFAIVGIIGYTKSQLKNTELKRNETVKAFLADVVVSSHANDTNLWYGVYTYNFRGVDYKYNSNVYVNSKSVLKNEILLYIDKTGKVLGSNDGNFVYLVYLLFAVLGLIFFGTGIGITIIGVVL